MRKPNNYWTKDRCKEEALKFSSKNDFKKYSCGAYSSAYKTHKCIDEICSHMKQIGNKFKRCIYSYEFSDNCVYVGLTSNINKRHIKHLKKGTVCEHIQINKDYKLIQLTEYVGVSDAQKLENEYVIKYSDNNWIILNKVKTGSAGGCTKLWIKDKCLEEALKYNSRKEFCLNSSGAYRSSLLNGWLDDICTHMPKKSEWNKNNCKIESLKYSSRFEFCKKSKSAYTSALNNGWLDDICEHMGEKIIKRNFWNYDRCKEESLKYPTRGEFSIKSSYAYSVSRKKNWLNDFFEKKY